MKNILLRFFTLVLIFSAFPKGFAATTYISGATGNGNFEAGATGWTIANTPAQTNKWFISASFKCGGANGAYVGTASGNNNYTLTTSSVSQLYKTTAIAFTAGETCISMSFSYRGQGESTYDGLQVFLTTAIPVAGTACSAADQVGATWYNLQAACTTANISIPASYAGTTKYLVFQWKNDASGGVTPAITLDDIILTSAAPSVPTCSTTPLPASGTTGVCTPVTLSWTAPVNTGCNGATGYDVYLDAGVTPPTTLVSSNQAGTSYTTGALLSGTLYYWKIVPRNSAGTAVGCATSSFTTSSNTYAALPISESFEGPWISKCDVREAPTTNWVNTPKTGNSSWRRDDDGVAAAVWGSLSGAYSPLFTVGAHSARYHAYGATPSGITGDLDLYVDCSPAGTKTLFFDYILSASSSASMQVKLSTDGGATFPTTLNTLTTAGSWTTYSANITSTSATCVVRFHAISDYGSYDIGLDNVSIVLPCAGTPTGGTTVTSITPICPNATAILSVTGSSVAGGLTYQWQSSTDNATWTNISGATSATYTATPAISTWYRRIITCTASGLSANSASVQEVVTLTFACYCTSTATSTADMDITKIAFGTINNSSAVVSLTGTQGTATGTAGEYSDWKASAVPVPSVQQGSTTAFTVIIGGTAYSHRVDVYIDLNIDGDFTDPGESFPIFAYANPALPNTTNSSITLPMTATVGTTVMRVVCVESSSTSPCGTYSWGETEDYKINITVAPPCAGAPAAGTATPGTASFTCSGATTITLTGYTIATGITFQWQSSSALAGPYSNIAGATSTAYTTPTISSTTYYRCITTCSNGGGNNTSSVATVTITPNVPGTASASPAAVCSGSTSTISLTGSTISNSTYQWQSSLDNATWTNIGGATATTYAASPAVATYYRCVITCTASATSLNSASVQVTMNLPANCYCTSSATSTSDMDITKIAFGTINNSSAVVSLTGTQGTATGTAGMYSNWRATAVPVPSVQQGSTTAFTVIIGGTAYSHRVDVYIDFNQDGDFVDAGESFPIFAYANPALPNTTASSITIPITATVGTTLMRVVCVESSSTSPCGTYTWGETEDYNINITAAPPCAGTPTGGTTVSSINPICPGGSTVLTVTGSTIATGLTYQWQASADNITWSNISGATSATYTATPSSNTYYRRIVTCTASGLSANSVNVLETITLSSVCYCVSGATSTLDMDITKVGFGTINNTSAVVSLTGSQGNATGTAGEYSNFWGSAVPVPAVMQGSTNAFTVIVGGTAYSHRVDVYIDFNQNGVLTDAGESFSIFPYGNPALPNTTTTNITIPITATIGNTLMRVVCIESSSTNPCNTYSYGETEDYKINITAAPICAGAPTPGTAATDLTNFCNSGSVNLSLTGYTIAVGITFQWQISSDNISWSNISLATNTTYASPLISQTTYYRCEVRCSASTAYSNVLTITKTAQTILTTNNPVNIACNATANLTATASGGATINWYAAASGGSVLGTGSPYTTPALSVNTTYYCVANSGSSSESGGMPAKSNTYGSLTNGNGIVFDATQAFTLNSVTIYPIKSGNVTIAYQNSSGVQQAITGSIAVNGGNPGNAVVVPLGWAIPIGTGYRLVLVANSGITDLIYDYNTNYNYNSPSGALSVTDGWYGSGPWTSSTNYYFYNLNISIPCESTPRTPVNVIITSGLTAPLCSTTPSPADAAAGVCPVATTISWASSNTACRAATSYLLYFGTDAAATNIINGVDIGLVTSYNLGTLAGSTQYYWKIVPKNSAGNAAGCSIWSFTTVGNPGSICPGLLGAGVIAVPSLPYASGAGTTAGAGDNLTSANVVTCGSSSYLSGEDQVFVFTPATSGSITIQLSSTGSYTGLMLYDGCPLAAGSCGAAPGTCVGSSTGYSGDKTLTVCIVAGTTYYLILDSYASPATNPYSNLTISTPSGTLVPPNDLPCNATSMSLGVLSNGDNSCSGSASEPTVPSCFTSGAVNTIWYSVLAPASGQLSVKTITGGLSDTQIGLYSGTCSSLTFVTNGCNDNISGCGSTSASQINMSGLTPGATYYVMVDGAYDLQGTFSIMAIDPATSTFPVTPGQDCTAAFPTCNSVLSISDPGFANTGSVCDFSSANNCMGSGERSSVWYTIQIQANGTLNFDIIPNDYSGLSAGNETDYDFIIWKTVGAGATSCAGISANAATGLVGCNYSYIGVTGIAAGGNAPPTFGSGFDAAYESSIPVLAGEEYTICISNFTMSTSGFTIDYTTTTPPPGAGSAINYAPSPLILNWTGTVSTAWTTTANWGSCNIPSCGISAVIGALVPTMPTISSNQIVNNLTINTGATLTINAGVQLTVCGNFVNNGTLIMAPTATLFFNNAATHQLSGNLSGTSAIGNLLITQTGGSVNLTAALDIQGNFTTTNATSILNTNGNYIKLAGNFINATGNTTFSNTGTIGTLEFNGTAAQTYNQGSSQLDLNFVKMNHTSTGVTLQTNMYIKSGTGTLNLTLGKIITNALEVNVANTATTSVSTGNTNSYVEGNLRRYLLATGSYDFPVGHASKFYQLANINFTAATSIGNLLARFDPWPGSAGYPPVQGGTECGSTYSAAAEDNGYWTITANANPLTGTYTTTLYPTNATNTAIANAWTVMKQPTLATTGWLLNGTCNVASTAAVVIRTAMNGFSVLGVAQAPISLPVELLYFDADYNGKTVDVKWITASEVNNNYFTVERSTNAIDFNSIGTVPSKATNGNSTSPLDYYLNDANVQSGIYYYRLKQTDFNGTYKYSNIVSVTIDDDAIFIIKPNPTTTTSDVIYTCFGSENATLKVFDYRGRLVVSKDLLCTKGQNISTIDLSEQPDGMFFVTLTTNEKVYKTKLLKSK